MIYFINISSVKVRKNLDLGGILGAVEVELSPHSTSRVWSVGKTQSIGKCSYCDLISKIR